MNNRDMGKKGGMSVKKMADGGMVDDKERGLAASSGEKVGFWERIKAGNIDDPKSEAYQRFGAGRARADDADARMNTTSMMEANSSPAPASAPAEPEMMGPAEPTLSEKQVQRDAPGASGELKAAVKDEVKKPATRKTAAARPSGGAAGGVANGIRMGQDAIMERRARESKAASAPAPKADRPRWMDAADQLMADTALPEDKPKAPKKSGFGPVNTMNTRAYDEAEKRKTATNPTGSIYGMANGGMVGDSRMRGKKC